MSGAAVSANPLVYVLCALLLLALFVLMAPAVRMSWEDRNWVVNAAVDRGSCAESRHVYLSGRSGPRGSRELIHGSPVCMAQIRRMLANAENFTCKTRGDYTLCDHPLNAADSTTEVRAVIGPQAALLEVTPT